MEAPIISPEQAAATLKQAAAIERRSASAYRYQRFAPYLFLWGIVWLAGYGSSDLWPSYSGWIWLSLILLALVVSIIIARTFADGQAGPQVRYRTAAFFVLLWAFFAATYAVFGPVSHLQQGAFPPLVVALTYSVIGLWAGWRLVIAGLAVGALTLGGFFYLPEHYLLWEALVGGGALILAGFWFRQA